MQVTFHGITAGGDGVGRDANGRTVFAPYAAPGDVAEVAILEERKTFARGHILRLESESPQRSAPPCPYFVPQNNDESTACGGCQIQHLSYAAQIDMKRALVRDALTHIGKFENPPVEACVPSPQTFAYRNKAEFFVGDDGAIGFHARRTHKVMDIARCPLLLQPLNDVLAAVRELFGGAKPAKSLEMRVDSRGAVALRVAWKSDAALDKKTFFAALRERVPSLVDPNQAILEEEVDGLKFRVGAFDFFQVNPSLTPGLMATAMQMAAPQPGQRALDLYCGSGLFGVFLARAGAVVTGVDGRGGLDANARLNGLKAKFVRGDAARFLRRAAEQDSEKSARYDLALLDPPRAGAAQCIEPLARLRPARIVYVSCDPATLARDLKALAAQGYALNRVVPHDMFPQTAHVEIVALLELQR